MDDRLIPMLWWGLGVLIGYIVGYISARQYYKKINKEKK